MNIFIQLLKEIDDFLGVIFSCPHLAYLKNRFLPTKKRCPWTKNCVCGWGREEPVPPPRGPLRLFCGFGFQDPYNFVVWVDELMGETAIPRGDIVQGGLPKPSKIIFVGMSGDRGSSWAWSLSPRRWGDYPDYFPRRPISSIWWEDITVFFFCWKIKTEKNHLKMYTYFSHIFSFFFVFSRKRVLKLFFFPSSPSLKKENRLIPPTHTAPHDHSKDFFS